MVLAWVTFWLIFEGGKWKECRWRVLVLFCEHLNTLGISKLIVELSPQILSNFPLNQLQPEKLMTKNLLLRSLQMVFNFSFYLKSKFISSSPLEPSKKISQSNIFQSVTWELLQNQQKFSQLVAFKQTKKKRKKP